MRRPALLSLLLHAAAIAAMLLSWHGRPAPPPQDLARIELVFGGHAAPPAAPQAARTVALVEADGDRPAAPAAQNLPARPTAERPGLAVPHPDASFVPVRDDPGNHAPEYPQEAVRRREQGTVVYRITIASDGSVTRLDKLSSSGSAALDHAAEQAFQHWHFLPARRNGQAVASYRDQPMIFQIP